MASEALIEQITGALQTPGYLVLDDALPTELVAGLQARVQSLAPGQMTRAGVGRQHGYQHSAALRNDHIHWLDAEHPVEAEYLAWMEQLRQGINRRLFLGLFDYECHFAVYQPGDYYKKHLDAFRGNTNRVVTTVCYLNDDWQPADGGELVVYAEHGETELTRVLPQAGRLVVFVSEQFPHEVLPAQRPRHSIAGWFRVNNSVGGRVDPAR